MSAGPVVSETASRGEIRATVSYTELGERGTWYTRLVVDRGSLKVYDARVATFSGAVSWKVPVGANGGGGRTITVRDLDGDGDPEILLDFWTGGAHCCEWTRIYRWDAALGTYVSTVHWWGNPTYELESLPGDGGVGLVTFDNRFAYAFASFAFSGMPIQVWSYRTGRLVDVTRRHLSAVRRDARAEWRYFLRVHGFETTGFLAAWTADECRLGRGARAFHWLESHPKKVVSQEGNSGLFVPRLREFLRRRGYAC